MEKCGHFWKNGRFSGRIWPDWGNTAWADILQFIIFGFATLESIAVFRGGSRPGGMGTGVRPPFWGKPHASKRGKKCYMRAQAQRFSTTITCTLPFPKSCGILPGLLHSHDLP